MRTVAQVTDEGAVPAPAELPDPTPGDGEITVRLTAAAINPVDLAIAGGRFYGDLPPLPYVAGAEAVGEVLAGPAALVGRRVWCLSTYGLWATEFTCPASAAVVVPDGIDDATAAAIGIAGLPGWMGVRDRGGLAAGETVLVLGAGGVVGQVAIHAAKVSGAGRIVAAARSAPGRERGLRAGADVAVDLAADDVVTQLRAACHATADVVIDPLWGEPAMAAMAVLGFGGRLVQIGNAAGPSAAVPAGTLRGGRLDIRGYSVFRESGKEIARAYGELAASVAGLGEPLVAIDRHPLGDVAAAWARQRDGNDGVKQVLVPA